MRRILIPAFLPIAAALALSGCGPVNRGLESVNQPVVARTSYALDLDGGGGDGLPPAEADRLGQWLDTLGVGYGDRVAIDDPGHVGGMATHEAVADVVAHYGLLLNDTAPVTAGRLAPGRLRVVVSRSSASVPNCPDFRGRAGPDLAGSTSANYGCAANGNLAAMVANPEDLVRGVASADLGTDPRASARAMKTYRDLIPTGAAGVKAESTGGGH